METGGRIAYAEEFRPDLERAGVPFAEEDGVLVVARRDALVALDAALAVQRRRRRAARALPPVTEAEIRRLLVASWGATPFGRRFEIVARGAGPADILARDAERRLWLVVDVAAEEAAPGAVAALEAQGRALRVHPAYDGGGITAAIVAERVPLPVRDLARARGIAAYESELPLGLRRVA
jgi:hypothetical protein